MNDTIRSLRKWLFYLLLVLPSIGHVQSRVAYHVDNVGEITILCLGDSLTEGYGIEKELAYPALIQKKYDDLKIKTPSTPHVKIINGAISGSTSASGVSRLKWYLSQKPQVLFLELGANDGLRGQNLDQAKKNLKDIITLARANHMTVWMAGMRIPTNYGADYTKKFHQMFEDIAKDDHLPFMPFLLESVALHKDLMQPDGLHPNEKGHAILAQNVFDFFQSHISEATNKTAEVPK